jgi:hypothetical protein
VRSCLSFEEDRVTRSHRRRLAAPAVAAALAVATGLLAACSAGQLAATSLVAPSVPGAQAAVTVAVPDGKPGSAPQTIQISNATVDYPGVKGYAAGDTAPLTLWIFNNTERDITLTAVHSDFGEIRISPGTHSGAVSPCLSSQRPLDVNPATGAPTAGVKPSPGASGNVSPAGPTVSASGHASAPPTGSAAPSGSASAAAPASPSAAAEGSSNINVPIKAFGCVALNRDAAQFLHVDQLRHAVGFGPDMMLPVQFTFVQAGGAQYTIPQGDATLAVPVDVPASPGSRAPADVQNTGE